MKQVKVPVNGQRRKEYLESLSRASGLLAQRLGNDATRYADFSELLKASEESGFLKDFEIYTDSGLPSKELFDASYGERSKAIEGMKKMPPYDVTVRSARDKIFEGIEPTQELDAARRRRYYEKVSTLRLSQKGKRLGLKEYINGKNRYEICLSDYENISGMLMKEEDRLNNVYTSHRFEVDQVVKKRSNILSDITNIKIGVKEPPIRKVAKSEEKQKIIVFEIAPEFDKVLDSMVHMEPKAAFDGLKRLENAGVEQGKEVDPVYVERISIGPFTIKETYSQETYKEQFDSGGFILKAEKRSIARGDKDEKTQVFYACSKNLRSEVENIVKGKREKDKANGEQKEYFVVV